MQNANRVTSRALQYCALVVACVFVAAPSESQTTLPAPNDSYHDRRFDIVMQRCVLKPVAICSITVTAKIDSVWDISAENRLIDSDGTSIPATSMVIGGQEFSVPSRNAQKMPAGVPTKIDLKFRGGLQATDVNVLMIYVGHWSAKVIRLRPNWVRQGM